MFALTGTGLAVRGGRDPGNVSAWSCLECGPGTPVSLDSIFEGELSLGQGPAVVDGVLHSRLYYAGKLRFTGSTAIPSEKPAAAASSVKASFQLEGELKGFLKDPAAGDPGQAVFSRPVAGKGTATLQLASTVTNGQGPRYTFRNLTYTFQ